MNTYEPKPIDTSDVVLSSELSELSEKIAENTHDVWAVERMKSGWTYGEQRDDVNKKHPCLIPYADLPDSEKEYDKSTSIETLKVITKLGFTITKDHTNEGMLSKTWDEILNK